MTEHTLSDKVTSWITQGGSVVITTLSSFAFEPPVLIPPDGNPVQWHNLFAFIAGILSAVVFSFNWKRVKLKSYKTGLMLLVSLIVCIVIYEILYSIFSVSCYGEVNCIISTSDVLPEVKPNLERWKNMENPVKSLLEAYDCSPLRVWSARDLWLPYYGILFLYLVILGLVTMSLAFVSKLITGTK